jgi:hypothetical protein
VKLPFAAGAEGLGAVCAWEYPTPISAMQNIAGNIFILVLQVIGGGDEECA